MWGEDIQCLICLVCLSPMILCLLLYMYTVETLRVRWRYTMSNMFSMSNCYICTQSNDYVWGEDIQCLICLVCQTIPMILCLLLYMYTVQTVETLRVRWRYTMSNMFSMSNYPQWFCVIQCLICLVCQTIPNDSVFIVIYVHSRNITCEVKIYNV